MKTISLLALTIGAAGMLITSPPSRAATETDKTINDKIFNLLMNDRSLAHGSQKMTATTKNGVVTLTGQVQSQTDKEQLHKAIAGEAGVQQVKDNELFLKPTPAGELQSDRPIGPNHP